MIRLLIIRLTGPRSCCSTTGYDAGYEECLCGEAMKSLKRMAAIILGLIVGIAAPALVAGYQKKVPDSYGNDRQLLRLVSVEDFPVYKPRRPSPPPLAPRGRVGSGVRGGGGEGSPLLPLAPDHVGFTIEEQPSLYWFLSQETSLVLEFTLRDDRSISPIIET